MQQTMRVFTNKILFFSYFFVSVVAAVAAVTAVFFPRMTEFLVNQLNQTD